MQNQTIEQEIKQYRSVFVTLITLTLIAVGIHYMNPPMNIAIFAILGLAVMQAVLSVCYFMHLISEKKFIFLVLTLTVSFFLGMILLIYWGHFSHPNGSHYVS